MLSSALSRLSSIKLVAPALAKSLPSWASLGRNLTQTQQRAVSVISSPSVARSAPTSSIQRVAVVHTVAVRSLATRSSRIHASPIATHVTKKWYTTEAALQKQLNAEIPSGDKQIGRWLSVTAGMVFGIVVVGGITRLTESGLSMVEWKPVTGALPPLSAEDWEVEFDKYKQFPEFKKINSSMSLSEFKKIYYWEWAHRQLGRAVGIVFAVPFGYFIAKKMLTKGQIIHYTGMLALGGAQGALGWYMVKSGLEVQDGEYPRVSPYRLCAHLGLAFTLYFGLFWGAMSMFRRQIVTSQPIPKWMKGAAGALTGLTFTTVMSGAFVAGNDAGLCYNEFPYMGDGFVPEEYWRRSPAWKNFTENSPAVQFNHRVLGVSTWASANILWLLSRRTPLPAPTRYAINTIAAVSWLQAGLGIFTLLHFVPTPLAAAHQAGALSLLTLSTWLLHTVVRRKPVIPLKL